MAAQQPQRLRGLINLQFVPFNSRDKAHKSIFGSTAAGEILRLSVCMPRSFSCSAVTLLLRKDGGEYTKKPLYWCSHQGDVEYWDISFSFEEEGLYFYRFSYETPFGTGNIFLKSGGCGEFSPSGKEWQQTVYKKGFETPDCFKGGIMYQIFPDRFYFSGEKKKNVPADRILHTDFSDIPFYKPDKNGKILNNDYFGGDFRGITEKLPYIKSLGVTVIYLNPVFEAHSNHRYNTADYKNTDPLLGTKEELEELVKKAEEYSIKIILDGVFSHTGSDSVYFNREKRYGDGGAYNDPHSPYREWYNFKDDGTYDCWWGIDTLPETDEENDGFIDFIMGENGVTNSMLDIGVAGFRLDVADELPDKFLDALYSSLKKRNPNSFVLGEVWEDASNKISHGNRRKYLLGGQLDSVMNYPFSVAILSFMRYGVAESFMESIVTICENYPKPVLDCLMNHLGTHDTARILSRLASPELETKPRDIQASHKLSQEEYSHAKTLLKTATVLQYTLPGFPSVYYGDEAGMTGGSDPFNRAFFPWGNEDKELTEWFIKLGKIRLSHPAFKTGEFVPFSAMLSCVAYKRVSDGGSVFVIANRNPHEIDYYLPDGFKNKKELITGAYSSDFIKIPPFGAAILTDIECNIY